MLTPDIRKVRDFVHSDRVAEAYLKLKLDSHDEKKGKEIKRRSRRNINIVRLKRILRETFDINADSKEIQRTFEGFERLGLGTIVYGRGGRPNRFILSYNIVSVAHAVLGDTKNVTRMKLKPQIEPKVKLPELSSTLNVEPVIEEPTKPTLTTVDSTTGKLILRKGDIELEIPSVMNVEERDSILALIDKISVAS